LKDLGYSVCRPIEKQIKCKKQQAYLGVSLLLVWLFFLVLDEGGVALAHHLPMDFVGKCILASAYDLVCSMVEAKTTSSK
jgi:hypothetical protein